MRGGSRGRGEPSECTGLAVREGVRSPIVRRTNETNMQTHDKNYSFAVFPFLKTRSTVSIGQLTFRSTDVTDGLSAEQAVCVDEIASMLFLQDNLRIKSASYAMIPFVDLNYPTADVEHV